MGGSAQEWSTEIPAEVVPGSLIELSITMTKFGGQPVRIAYEIVVEHAA